jgi:AAA+ superfamily predicted ATPase
MTTSLDHTLAHLARLDLFIRREVLRVRATHPHRDDEEFRGLYISEADVDAMLASPLWPSSLLSPSQSADLEVAVMDRLISELDRRVAQIEHQARDQGGVLPIQRLSQFFGLTELDLNVLVISLAAEIDLKYERLFAYLQDDVTKKRPTVDLVMRLLCPTISHRLAARRLFDPDAPLMRWSLIGLYDDPNARRPVLPARYLKLDDRIAGFLLDSPTMDPRLIPLLVADVTGLAAVHPDVRRRMDAWATGWISVPWTRAPVINFSGRYGSGRRASLQHLAAALGRSAVGLDASALLRSEVGLVQGVRLAEREALLTGALLCWTQADLFTDHPPTADGDERSFIKELARGQAPTIVLTERPWEPGRSLEGRPFLRLEMLDPTYPERRALWTTVMDAEALAFNRRELDAITGRFRLTHGQMLDAVSYARSLAWARDPAEPQPGSADIDAACRAQAQHGLAALARKLIPRYGWDDIVLPPQQLSSLRLIGAMIRQRPVVYGDWGFDRKLAMGKGVIALFAGPSGTGKTMAAEIIAHDLSLDLYKIDLSAVVSKYIGETEKNLERIFREAQHSDAILFFDEADALFGKRSEVKDAHDRYANIETAYLLQRTEEYDGLVILASNLKRNMDEAFIRRLHFTIDFPEPEEVERLELWRRTLPKEAPRADDIDLEFLARKLKITGGSIRNIILAAAFLAAEENSAIAMRHLVRASVHELQKMGRLVVEADFGAYFGLVKF